MDYSVIVPIHGEYHLVEPAMKQWLEVFTTLNIADRCEILLIADSIELEQKAMWNTLIEHYPNVSVICLRSKATTSFALSIGMFASSGKYIINLINGLNTSLNELPHLMKSIAEGQEVAVAIGRTGEASLMICKRVALQYFRGYRNIRHILPQIARAAGLKVAVLGTARSPLRLSWLSQLFSTFTFKLIKEYANRPLVFFGAWSIALSISAILGGSLIFFGLALNVFLIGVACEFILYHLQRPNYEQHIRLEIESILGADYARQKITYGLVSNKMKAAL